MEPKYYGAAAQYNKPGGFQINRKLLVIGALALVIIVVLMAATAVISGLNAGPSRDMATLVAMESDLEVLAKKSRERIKSADLRKINADVDIMLLSNSVTLTAHLSDVYGMSAIPKEIIAANTDTQSADELKAAEQVSKFDSVYNGLLRTKIAALLQQAHKVENQVGDAAVKATMADTISMLSGLDDQLTALQP